MAETPCTTCDQTAGIYSEYMPSTNPIGNAAGPTVETSTQRQAGLASIDDYVAPLSAQRPFQPANTAGTHREITPADFVRGR